MINKIIFILILILFTLGIFFFLKNQKKNIRQWLLYAVIQAEKNLGSKTGELKLRQVYSEFIALFPIISKIISFDYFSNLVDLALFEMKALIEENHKVKKYVEGEENV